MISSKYEENYDLKHTCSVYSGDIVCHFLLLSLFPFAGIPLCKDYKHQSI